MLEIKVRLILSAINALLLILVISQMAYFMLNPQPLKRQHFKLLFILSVVLLAIVTLGLTISTSVSTLRSI